MKKIMNGGIWLMMLVLLTGLSHRASAETEVKFNDFLKEVKFKGDLRLRHENFDRANGRVDRQRQRFRLRLGADFKLPNNVKIKTRFASGGGDQNSTNQTFTSNASQKSIWIDQAYLTWAPIDSLNLQAGRMANPMWTIYSSDVMWDSDYNPEGAGQNFETVLGNVGLFFNAGQFSLAEVSGDTEDVYAFSEQGGVEIKLPMESRIRTGIAHHEFANITKSSLGSGDAAATSSHTANGAYYHNFSILEWTTQFVTQIGNFPLAVEFEYAKNNGVKDIPGQDKQDQAVQAGLIVGKAKKAGSFEAAYFYKEVESDAVIDQITDSDFPYTNRKGHIGWIAYAITDFAKAKVKYFDTEKILVGSNGDKDDIGRLQIDLETKF